MRMRGFGVSRKGRSFHEFGGADLVMLRSVRGEGPGGGMPHPDDAWLAMPRVPRHELYPTDSYLGETDLTDSRTLIYIPIVHSEADMGSSSDDVRQAYIRQKGLEAWETSRAAIKRVWADIDTAISALHVDFHRMRLYQDGLPVCGFEERIVRDLAGTPAGGVNYQILARLMDLGARLEGTEDLELLLKEREMLKSGTSDPLSSANATVLQAESASVKRELLHDRDCFIARRIDETLQPGEIGLLFLGALHDATAKLPATIKVVSLDDPPIFNGAQS